MFGNYKSPVTVPDFPVVMMVHTHQDLPSDYTPPLPDYSTPSPAYPPPSPAYTPPTPDYSTVSHYQSDSASADEEDLPSAYTPPSPDYTPPSPGFYYPLSSSDEELVLPRKKTYIKQETDDEGQVQMV